MPKCANGIFKAALPPPPPLVLVGFHAQQPMFAMEKRATTKDCKSKGWNLYTRYDGLTICFITSSI